MKIKGFLEDVGGAGRVTKRRLAAFADAPAAKITRDPIGETARLLHPESMTFRVAEVYDVSPTARTFRLVCDERPLPVFQAGQYLSLSLRVGETVTTRPYSLSSAPFEARGENGFVEITVRRRGPNFIPDWLFANARPGDTFTGSMPYGHFYWEPLRDSKKIVALIGGVGVTPIHSLAREIRAGGIDAELTVLYGSMDASDIVFKDEFDAFGCDRVKFVYVLSDDPAWPGEKGFLTAELIRKYAPEDASYFICGPQAMYNFIAGELKKLPIPRRRIRNEVMGAPKDALKIPGYPAEAAGKTFRLTVVRGIREDVIDASAAEPVVVALERAGIPILTDCRSGACGFCRSHLLSGSIFVRPDGDGRRAMDRETGWFHPCASYPVSDLKIKIPIL